MRVLWHSAAPWIRSGYGTQTALWTRYLRDAGHDVAISSYYGNPGQGVEWEGMHVFPAPVDSNAHALVVGHAEQWRADVIVLLCDVWLIEPGIFAGARPVLAWTPIDTTPMSIGDARFLTQGPSSIRAVAMSEHGRDQMRKANIDVAAYIPHAIDVDEFKPERARDELRAAFGIGPDTFAVGLNFNNIDAYRKATPNAMAAFATFRKARPDSLLFVHSMTPAGLDLEVVATTHGITDVTRFADQYRMRTGDYSTRDMVRWYSAMDVLVNATCGEGFGLPSVEAQACGTPVILSDNTTGPQLAGPGAQLVDTTPWWNPAHNSWWGMPDVDGITQALHRVANATRSAEVRTRRARWAARYDYRTVGPAWLKLLDSLAEDIDV